MTSTPRKRRRHGDPLNHEPEAVYFARDKAGLSQRALGEMCGWSEQLQCDIEAGRRNADHEKLLKIAAATNTPVVFMERRREVSA